MASKTRFSCGELLDVTAVASLKIRLHKALEKSSTIELQADDVKKADTAGLQLFLALSRDVSGAGGALIWKKPSQALIEAARLLGLDRELGLS